MSIKYVHPSTHSRIIDNSTVYITSQGTTKLFTAFTSDKGVDNKIKLITSPSEFIFEYGNPDIQKHGQAGYNAMNWLKSGGGLYALRVLPDDAGYANAIINIQTKEGSKEVKNSDGDTITVPDVEIRPVVSHTDINNVSVKTLEYDELRKDKNKTIDGFRNNMLFAVVPRGRGEGHNDLGFKLTLTSDKDSTYDFRIYNFETTQRMASGAMETIEGPFEVSLDPNAMDRSGESLFIEYVIEENSDYFNVIFNNTNYEKLGKIINPHVHPKKLDFFNGTTKRNPVTDEIETYFDPDTGQDEDIHFYLNEYINLEPTGKKNIVDSTNPLEDSVADLDNNYRNGEYRKVNKTLERLKVALSRVTKITDNSNPFETLVKHLLPSGDDLINVEHSKLEDLFTELEDVRSEYEIEPTSSNLNKITSVINSIKNSIEFYILDLVQESLDYSRIMGTSDETISIESNTLEIKKALYSIQKFNLQFIDMKNQIINIENELDDIILENIESRKIQILDDIILLVENIFLILLTLESDEYKEADSLLLQMDSSLEKIREEYEIIEQKYTPEEDREEAIKNAIQESQKVLKTTSQAIDAVFVELNMERIIDKDDIIENVVDSSIALLELAVDRSPNITADEIIEELESVEKSLEANKQLTYNNSLQNFDQSVRLSSGTDGSLDLDNPDRRKVIDSLLIKAYTGLIDESILDKKTYPIDLLLDSNESVSVKNSMVDLVNSRGDFMAFLDTGFQTSPQGAINFRRNRLQVDNFRVALFTQDFIVNDDEYSGRNIKVTSPYFLASKIPENDNNHGIHWNFVGPRRGPISGFEKISFVPNPEWKEQLYKAQINYVEADTLRTKFGSQLTTQSTVSALSNINNVRTLLRIQRDVEYLMEDYQFEFNDSATSSAAQLSLNGYLNTWVTNRACDSISGSVYAGDYDRKQKIMRVRIDIIFNSIVERILIDLSVNN